MHEHELFPLQALAKRNHAITPVSQAIKLYLIHVNLTHEADGVKLTLSPAHPILKHSSFGERPEGCTDDVFLLSYDGKTHEELMMVEDDSLVVHVGTHNISSFLETLAGAAQFFHLVHNFMVRAVDQAVSAVAACTLTMSQ